MAVENGVNLVAPLGRLVDALRVDGEHLVVGCKQRVELLELHFS